MVPHCTSLSPARPLLPLNAGNRRGHHQQLLGRAPLSKIPRTLEVWRPRPSRTFNAAEMVAMTNEGELFEYGVFDMVMRCACPAAFRGEQVNRCLPELSFATSPAASACMAACTAASFSDPDALCLSFSCAQQQYGRLHCTSNASREARGAPGSGCAAARRAVQGRCFRPG